MLIPIEDWNPRKGPVALKAPDAWRTAIERDGLDVGST